MVKEKNELGEEKLPKKEEKMIPLSDVKKLIADAIASSKEPTVMSPKKVTEHHAQVWRLDGKWVVDFVNRNTDPYVKKEIFAYEKYNAEKREFESWIEIKFQDGTTKDISLKNYVSNRVLVYCLILKKEKIDRSYSLGQVEKKDWKGDKMVGTGVMMEQIVEMHNEVVTIKTPDGEILEIPDHAIC